MRVYTELEVIKNLHNSLDIYKEITYISTIIKNNNFFTKNSSFSKFLDIYPYENKGSKNNVQSKFT